MAAIDLGKARVGVAVADELGVCAHPRPFLEGRNRRALLDALAALARDEGIQRFLVGAPLELDGREGPQARRAAAFAQALADATGVEVELVDERLSTVEASRRLREGGVSGRQAKARLDGAAAAILLQAWLDRGAMPQRNHGQGGSSGSRGVGPRRALPGGARGREPPR